MKNLTRIIMAAALLGGSFLLGSCTKNEFGQAGRLVRFGASADGAMTKTEYAGKDNDASGIEPIWWKAGDQVRIVSDYAIVTNTEDVNYSDYKFSDYKENNKSRATVANVGTNGLAWNDDHSSYKFYAVYPSTVNIGYATGNLGDIMAEIPSPQAVVAHEYDATKTGDNAAANWYHVTNGKYTVYEPEMQYAVMTAAKTGVAPTEDPVKLTFYPAFTAFEFTFESADPLVDITLTDFEMVSTSTALSGIFTGAAGSRAFAPVETAAKSVKLSNPGALGTIKNGEPKSFTIFAMPQELTDISIKFTDGEGTRVLALKDKDGNALKFTAGHKYRIKGLKLPGNKYQFFLTINGIVMDWDTDDVLETIFSAQVQCSAPTFDKSAREMTDEYKDENGGKTNNYKDSPIGDGRWQVRTLNNANLDGENHDYFTVFFTPTAPLGGYWRLVPYNAEYWTIQVVEKEGEFEEHLSPLPNEGRIMNQPVELRITPKWAAINAAPSTAEIGLYFDCFFSTTIEFDPVLDANTEFQDIHGAGTYSYWLLTVERQ